MFERSWELVKTQKKPCKRKSSVKENIPANTTEEIEKQSVKSTRKPKHTQRKAKKKTKLNRDDFSVASSDSSNNLHLEVVYNDSSDKNDDKCLICDDRGKDEDWYCCSSCQIWYHSECSGWSHEEIRNTLYKCDFCISTGNSRQLF